MVHSTHKGAEVLTGEEQSNVVPLRIANERFLVAATIERCPRSMMLRELVMNALEAAPRELADGTGAVAIDAVPVDGVRKLRIWNTGRGLSADELLAITNLSSSLFKTVGLESNFGMGAKAASLTSNRHGLRYRSARGGVVSEVVLGERGGTYGRLRLPDAEGTAREVRDVSALYRAEDREEDFTEVVLMGNAPAQDTVRDPYAGDPPMPPGWIADTLARRFVRLPAGVTLTVDEGDGPVPFVPPLAHPGPSVREESVLTEGGLRLHYRHSSEELVDFASGRLVYDDEIYGVIDGKRWLLEAPTCGITFAAREVAVLVELDASARVQPEQYRQFLRFADGEQNQVQFADFAAEVRRHMPHWLHQIVESRRPAADDYLGEIREELAALMGELGVRQQPRRRESRAALQRVMGALAGERSPRTPTDVDDAGARAPVIVPPEIVVLDDVGQLAEKALAGRAARYYPGERQLFVNARYEAFHRLRASLANAFAGRADEASVALAARQAAEWTLTQRLGRSLVHGLAKSVKGWSEEELRTVQSPEALSVLVDDTRAHLPAARRRMAGLLGLEDDGAAVEVVVDPRAQLAEAAAARVAAAEAQLQQAMAVQRPLGPFYANLAKVFVQAGDTNTARAFLDKGLAGQPDDPSCHHEMALLHMREGHLEEAAAASDRALALVAAAEPQDEGRTPFERRRAQIDLMAGHPAHALERLQRARDAEPDDPWLAYDIAGVHLADPDGDLDAADREMADAQDAAAELSAFRAPFARRRAEIEGRRGRRTLARGLLEEALGDEPSDRGLRMDLVRLCRADGEDEAALAVLNEGIERGGADAVTLLRLRSDFEMERGDGAAALSSAIAACEIAPGNAELELHRATLLTKLGDLSGAEAALGEALEASAAPLPAALRLRAVLAARRGDFAAGRRWLEEAFAIAPDDPAVWFEASSQLLAQRAYAEADDAAVAAGALNPKFELMVLRRRADIAGKAGDLAAARGFIEDALEREPDDPVTLVKSAWLYVAEGDDASAREEVALAEAQVTRPTLSTALLRAQIARRQKRWPEAIDALQDAARLDPRNPSHLTALSMVYATVGDVVSARRVAEEADRLRMTGGPGRA